MKQTCAVTGKTLPPDQVVPLSSLRPQIAEKIRAICPGIEDQASIGHEAINAARLEYVRGLLESQAGELDRLDKEVVESLHRQELVTQKPLDDDDGTVTFAQRVSDKLASFGGSWTFILAFVGFMLTWIGLNVFWFRSQGFDPYPFILLNLVLSCLAALQAPVIMMSQNRQETRDRLRAENDYKINLKAELEIRHLHERVDYLLHQQASRLLEVQEIQVELMKELSRAREHRVHSKE